jgi:hypothetical protein
MQKLKSVIRIHFELRKQPIIICNGIEYASHSHLTTSIFTPVLVFKIWNKCGKDTIWSTFDLFLPLARSSKNKLARSLIWKRRTLSLFPFFQGHQGGEGGSIERLRSRLGWSTYPVATWKCHWLLLPQWIAGRFQPATEYVGNHSCSSQPWCQMGWSASPAWSLWRGAMEASPNQGVAFPGEDEALFMWRMIGT